MKLDSSSSDLPLSRGIGLGFLFLTGALCAARATVLVQQKTQPVPNAIPFGRVRAPGDNPI